ncbi:DUF6455 family protein [Roseibium sp.]|uniref:DUF6455 family protein n=1 Tax=Roseibium sp. TaxID=1936156 RepID=UPI003A96FC0A
MRWIDRMNERADLMGRMIQTIGAMDKMPAGLSLESDLRLAASRCLTCSHTKACARWLEDNCEGADAPMSNCPNAEVFSNWLKT